jgi:hypothetical protein
MISFVYDGVGVCGRHWAATMRDSAAIIRAHDIAATGISR